jgi:endonuclease/exonuclease/phosphatase family metal-dependent hydrolase
VSERLRVMTYNVHGCVGVDRKLDLDRIAGVIAREAPDLVALQELDVGRRRSGGVDQAGAIARRLGMSSHFHAAFRVEEEEYGDAVLSALPLRLVRAGPLPKPAGVPRLERRGALWAALELPGGGELQAITTHLGLVPLEQRGQVDVLLGTDWAGAEAFAAGPSLLLGDFNATSRYAAYRRIAARCRDLQRELPAEPVRTFPGRLPMLRIDHVFAAGPVRAVECWVPNTAAARVASDHLPLVMDLEVG